MRRYYGAYVSMPDSHGRELCICVSRATADRIRRVTRAWLARDGWGGADTMRRVADHAAEMPGRLMRDILRVCIKS